jgi:hypothetical protein
MDYEVAACRYFCFCSRFLFRCRCRSGCVGSADIATRAASILDDKGRTQIDREALSQYSADQIGGYAHRERNEQCGVVRIASAPHPTSIVCLQGWRSRPHRTNRIVVLAQRG